ncbi:MAG: DUF4383 domain-containing protein [Acidimicrobiia bacterium]
MAADLTTGSDATTREWTPAGVFMVASAILHIPLGSIGLIYDQTFPIGANAAAKAGSENVFGIFETNGWHSLAALLLGVVSLCFALRSRHARAVRFSLVLSMSGGWWHSFCGGLRSCGWRRTTPTKSSTSPPRLQGSQLDF